MRKIIMLTAFIMLAVPLNNSFAGDNLAERLYNIGTKSLDSGIHFAGGFEFKRINDFVFMRNRDSAEGPFAIVKSNNSNGYMTIARINDAILLNFAGKFNGEGVVEGNKIEFYGHSKDSSLSKFQELGGPLIILREGSCSIVPIISEPLCEIIPLSTNVDKITVKITIGNKSSVEQTYNITGFYKAFNAVRRQ